MITLSLLTLSQAADAKLNEVILNEVANDQCPSTIWWLAGETLRAKELVVKVQKCLLEKIKEAGVTPDTLDTFLNDKKMCKTLIKKKEERKTILKFLNEWNNVKSKAKALEGKIRKLTFNAIEQKGITNIVHLWKECVLYNAKDLFMPFDQISASDVKKSFFIGGKMIPKSIEIGSLKMFGQFTSEESFYWELFSNLSEKCGFEPLFFDEVKCILELKGYQKIPLSDQVKHCYKLLQLGSINSWSRADYYFRHRFESLLPSKQCLNSSIRDKNTPADNMQVEQVKNETKILFHDGSVEQINHFNICLNGNSPEIASYPLSWKVANPVDGKWQCFLRPLGIDFSENISFELATHIVKSFENYESDVKGPDPDIIVLGTVKT